MNKLPPIKTINDEPVTEIMIPRFGNKMFKVHERSVLHTMDIEIDSTRDMSDDEYDIYNRRIFKLLLKNDKVLPGDILYVTSCNLEDTLIHDIRIIYVDEFGQKNYERVPCNLYDDESSIYCGIPIYKELLNLNPHFFRSTEFRVAEHIKEPYNRLTISVKSVIKNQEESEKTKEEQRARLYSLSSNEQTNILKEAFDTYLKDTRDGKNAQSPPLIKMMEIYGEDWSDYMYSFYTTK